MRADMGKLITEAARYGSFQPSEKTALSIRWDGPDGNYDVPSWAPRSSKRTKTVRKWGGKEFSDVLPPLRRWLDKQLGRPWNDVYREICAHLDKRKVTHSHVIDHALQWIEVHAYLGVDGQYHGRGGYRPAPVDGIFVHPDTGLVCRQKRREKPAEKREIRQINLSDLESYEKLGGFWYFVRYRKTTPEERGVGHGDHIRVSKRQIGGKELRDLREKLRSA